MALQLISRQIFRQSSRVAIRGLTYQENTGMNEQTKENSSEYSSDGEKIHCDLKFTQEGNRTEEELAFILESARAKAFAESTVRVVNVQANSE